MKCTCGSTMIIITRNETNEDGEVIDKHSYYACDECGRDTE
jgi:hypothetical protein